MDLALLKKMGMLVFVLDVTKFLTVKQEKQNYK